MLRIFKIKLNVNELQINWFHPSQFRKPIEILIKWNVFLILILSKV